MALFSQGTLRINGGTIATYTTPFNVDVVKYRDTWQTETGADLYISPTSIPSLAFNNAPIESNEIVFNGSPYMQWQAMNLGAIDWTLETEIKLTGNDGGYDYFFGNQVDSQCSNSFLVWFYGDNTNRFIAWSDNSNYQSYYSTASVFTIGQYFVLTICKVGNAIHIFKDGIKIGEFTLTANIGSLTYPLTIGKSPWINLHFTNARMKYFALLLGEGKYTENFYQNYRVVAWR